MLQAAFARRSRAPTSVHWPRNVLILMVGPFSIHQLIRCMPKQLRPLFLSKLLGGGKFLRRQGAKREGRIIVMLPNVAGIWEIMLAALKLGAILIPASTLLTEADLRHRLERGQARHVIAAHSWVERFRQVVGDCTRIVHGGSGARLDRN